MRTVLALLGILAISSLAFIGCTKFTPTTPYSQEELVAKGWYQWDLTNYDSAITLFEDAIDVENSYAPAYSGLGWTYLRQQYLDSASNEFETAKLLDGNLIFAFVGSSSTLFLNGNYQYSIDDGLYALAHWGSYTFPKAEKDDGTLYDVATNVTDFDVHMILALDYYCLMNMNDTINQINDMRVIIGESGDFNSTSWAEIAAELNRLDGLDPSQ
jgi:tetratricopeptide (TPR) repeat protein